MTSQLPEGESARIPHPPFKPERRENSSKSGRRAQPFFVPDTIINQGSGATDRYLQEHDAERVAAIEREHNKSDALQNLEGELAAMQAERLQQERKIIEAHPEVVWHESGPKIFCEDRE